MGTHECAKLALAAHLHVLLRRHAGRVTDVEWLATNADYAAEIVRIARAEAARVNEPQLEEGALRFAEVLQPRSTELGGLVGVRANAFGNSIELVAVPEPAPDRLAPPETKYVGGIR